MNPVYLLVYSHSYTHSHTHHARISKGSFVFFCFAIFVYSPFFEQNQFVTLGAFSPRIEKVDKHAANTF